MIKDITIVHRKMVKLKKQSGNNKLNFFYDLINNLVELYNKNNAYINTINEAIKITTMIESYTYTSIKYNRYINNLLVHLINENSCNKNIR